MLIAFHIYNITILKTKIQNLKIKLQLTL